ncbi:MAG: 50S ribosomal protein L30e [Candidatus Diapherotrites archaeon]|nr:50S ribosomal protein L30e [Candidatus Diapherotrites archaeon]
MEATEIIKRVIETGEVVIGARRTLKLIATGKPKLVILSENCPEKTRDEIKHMAKIGSIPVYTFNGTSLQLGEICGKPFPISAMVIKNPGDAKITELIRGAEK